MPKRAHGLVDEIISSVLPKDKAYKLSDGGGLYLLVTPTGSKLWRLQYRLSGKQKMLAFGSYPSLSLADARQRRDDAKKLLANGVDPAPVFQNQKRVEHVVESVSSPQTVSVRVTNNGFVDIWKGRFVVCLTTEEAEFIQKQLCKLLND